MREYIDILMVALVTVYIVDLSGFTASWRSLLARLLKVKTLKPLPPFDCSLCMVWWVCITFSLIVGTFSLFTLAYIALLSFLSVPLGQMMMFIKEGLIALTNKLFDLL